MITQLQVQNFRSIQNAALDLGKITVLTGANNSGKSSFIYSLLCLKNIMSNPNRSMDSLLTPSFINLGGFEQTVFNKDEDLNIDLNITIDFNDLELIYGVSLGKKISSFHLKGIKPNNIHIETQVSFPYPVNKNIEYSFQISNSTIKVIWNGLTGQIIDGPILESRLLSNFLSFFALPISTLTRLDFVPIRRGFTNPYFGVVPLTQEITKEEEIATLLSLDRELVQRVAHYLEKIVDKSFSVYNTPGISNFYLQVRDRKNGFTTDLVNEGLGTNQLVTLLTKILYSKNTFICIDEPEIHLHPSMIDKLVSVMVEIAEKDGKQFLLSTHSEHIITSLLNCVAKSEIHADDVKVYYLTKEDKETVVELQRVNSSGQIEGGLKNFYSAELDDLKTFFKISD